ncbi:MAG TPA: glycosyltransferase family 4 protein [Candidatus Limnocylindria bacterium]|nr:glycosyltransferase family 4 protein [Candidatus Limnocylindria bacterium]
MRVGLVCPYSWRVPGGVQSHVAGLARALGALGVEAEILAPEGGDVPLGPSLPIPSNGSVQRVALHPASVVRTALAVRRYDLVHLHEPMLPAACLSALWAARVPVVGTFHMYRRALLWYAVFAPVVRLAARRLDACLAVSRAAAEYARRGTGRAIEIVPNGIEYDELSRLRGQRAGRRILFVGRDEPRKGLDVLRRAQASLEAEAELVVVGPDGRVPQARLLEELARADVLVAPSLRGESFGLVLVEAMAAGLPVVASDIPGYRDVLCAGGVLVPPGDPAALAAALGRLLADPGERARLGEAGRREAAQYAWPRVAEQVLAVYERVL